ncbi:hypothetical protein MBLNU230_g1221t1 [Neophaeotheca triangularis]
MPANRTEILHAYRALYKHSLRAVQYSIPSRYTFRDHIRSAFRSSHVSEFDAIRIAKTLQFLDGAAKYRGLEHRIVKNLSRVWWERARLPYQRTHERPDVRPFRMNAYDDFDRTIEGLNTSMGLCIK